MGRVSLVRLYLSHASLRLIVNYFEQPGRLKFPAFVFRLYQSRFVDEHDPGPQLRSVVIIVLIDLVKLSRLGKVRHARQ